MRNTSAFPVLVVAAFLFTTTAVDASTFVLGTSALLEGPAAGTNSVVLSVTPSTATWTATSNNSWLTVSAGSASGTGSANIAFTFTANAGATRSGTLTIGGQTLTVTQAGSTYLAAPLTTLASSGLNGPAAVAVDSSGNVYIADTQNSQIKKWTAATQKVSVLTSTHLLNPQGVAVDGAGNLYITSTASNTIQKWTASTQMTSALVSTGLNAPTGIALDSSGNVYFADTNNNVIKKWTAATQTVSTLVFTGLNGPSGLAVDAAGNVYFADTYHAAVKVWTAATQTVSTLVSSGLSFPTGVAVDGSGNLYIADQTGAPPGPPPTSITIYEWRASTQSLSTLMPFAPVFNSSTPFFPFSMSGVAVDGSGNVYMASDLNNVVNEVPNIFVPGVITEPLTAGTDALTVLPTTLNLALFSAPSSDSSWLTVGSQNGNSLNFSFTANATGTSRGGRISLLGQSILVSQAIQPTVTPSMASLAANAATLTLSGTGFDPTADNNTVILSDGAAGVVTAATPTSLTVTITSPPTSTGPLSAVVITGGLSSGSAVQVATLSASYVLGTSALTEGAASGTDSVALAVTPAASAWTATPNAAWLHLSSPNQSGAGSGVVVFTYDANPGATRSGTLTIGGQTLTVTQAGITYMASTSRTTLVPGLYFPASAAVDSSGNVYTVDYYAGSVRKWNAATQTMSTPVPSGLSYPTGVAVDSSGNLYISEGYASAILKWTAATQTLSTLISTGVNGPGGVAVDSSGNVYFSGGSSVAIMKWTAATQTISTLVSTGLNDPTGLAVDGAGNVYIADTKNNAIKKWTAATQTVSTLVSGGLNGPTGVSVDSSGNVYIADSNNNEVEVWNATTLLSQLVTNGLNNPNGVGVDGAGNVYIVDSGNNALKKWTAATQTVSTLVSTSLAIPAAVAVDGSGNAYITDSNNNAIKKWTASTQTTSTIVSSGLSDPIGVAVDSAGNIYFSDYGNGAIKKWTAATQTVSTLVSSGIIFPAGVAVDSAGNVYFTDAGNNTVGKWTAVTQAVTTLASTGLLAPEGVAVDSSGNVYIADSSHSAIKVWTAATQTVSTLVSTGLNQPEGVAVDGSGNVYIADYGAQAIYVWKAATQALSTLTTGQIGALAVDGSGNVLLVSSNDNSIEEVSRGFVDPTAKPEGTTAGTDALPVALPANENLQPPFAPWSDQSWLTVGAITSGVVSFNFTVNNTINSRTGHITLLGQPVTVTQAAAANNETNWRQTWFGTTSTSGNLADTASHAGDGISNLLKYGLGLNPLVPANPSAVLPSIESGSANPLLSDRLALSFTIPNPSPSDVTYTVQGTADMVSWTTVATKVGTGSWIWNTTAGGATSHIVETDGATTSTLQIGDILPSSGNPHRFMCLQVTGP